MDNSSGSLATSTRETTTKMRGKGTVPCTGLMGVSIKDIGLKERNMEWV